MIKKISVTNHVGNVLELELARPERSGFAIKQIQGLSPLDANISTTETVTSDGVFFNSARLSGRTIKINLVLLDVEKSIEELRHEVYTAFPIKKKVRFAVTTDKRYCYIDGYVSRNEVELFSKQEYADISIECPDPYFYDANPYGEASNSMSSIDPDLEFPYESRVPASFSHVVKNPSKNIQYNGDSTVGVEIHVNAHNAIGDFTIWKTYSGEAMKIYDSKIKSLTGSSLKAGDKIVINTVHGNKYVKLFRDGTEINIIGCLDIKSDWINLEPGDNIMSYSTTTSGGYADVEIRNRIAYVGV